MAFDIARLSKVGSQLWQCYGTPEKQDNARKLDALTADCAEQVDAYPWRVVLEPGNVCNLRCAACVTDAADLPKGLLSVSDVDLFLRDLWPYLVQVNLFNWGEPLLHPRLWEFIEVIHSHNVGTQVHSNMNRLPTGLAEKLIDAGLDFLVASIDGVTQEVYARYRVGGSCHQALKNLERFVNIRCAKGVASPKIIWRMLCFPHNLHQIEEAARLARRIGVDDFAVAPGCLHGQAWTPEGPIRPTVSPDQQPPYCTDLYDFPIIHWDGTVLPCCFARDTRFAWGDLKTSSWREAFNAEPFRSARRLARGDQSANGPCTGCFRIPKPVELQVS